MEVKIKKIAPDAVIPTYAKDGDMCMDITAAACEFDDDNKCWVYHTGLAFQLPSGHGMLIFPRSSNRKTNCYLPNSVGVLDSGYRGELMVCFKERDMNNYRFPPYKPGDRIAQICIIPYPRIEFVEVDALDDSERGDGGFGSTGK